MKAVSGSRKAFCTTATIDCGIQEMDRAAATQIDMVQDRAWIAYFPLEADVKEGDLIQDDASGRTYKVLETTDKDYYSASNQHKEVILVDHESDE